MMRFIWDSINPRTTFFVIINTLIVSCSTPDTLELQRTFSPQFSPKAVTSQYYYHISGFCSYEISINNDSTYTWESGCEGRSHPSFGKWFIRNDSIVLVEKPASNLISFNISFSSYSKNKFTTFIILDKAHQPIKGFAIVPFNDSSSNRIGYYDDKDKTDSLGILKVRKNKTDSLDFPKLFPFTNRRISVSNNNLPDTVKLVINMNKSAFWYDDITYKYKERNTSFKWVDNKIVSNLLN